MARLKNIEFDSYYKRLESSAADLKREDAGRLRRMWFHILLIREFEQRLLDLKDAGQVHGPVHSSIGQEGGAVAACERLSAEDIITSTHRGHHHFLAKTLNAESGHAYDPTATIPAAVQEVVTRTLAEICGLAMGYCRGRGGSMHLGYRKAGVLGTNAIVAGAVPCATGAAWAHRMSGNKHVSVAFLGDGAMNQGAFAEVMNMAALWKIPVVYFIENNLYAVATHVNESTALPHLAQRALGFGIPALVCDGMDPVAVLAAMDIALEHARGGNGPFVIEAETYRFLHQAQSAPGSAFGYRSKDEEAAWREKDPAVTFRQQLIEAGVLTGEQADELAGCSRAMVAEAVETITTQGDKPDVRTLDDSLFPTESDLLPGLRSDGHEFEGVEFVERGDFTDFETRKLIDVIPEVIGRRMETDERAIIMGEEVGKMRGGAFMATKDLFRRHRERVIDTPISESGFSGMALGLAIQGRRPIIEIMYPDFCLVAADQIFNQIPKSRYMYGDQWDVPLVLRTRVGIGSGYGAQHSLEPAPLYAMFPGWRIVAPATAFDYVGLFNTAFRSLDPVLVIEHAFLYLEEGEAPGDRDYCIAFGKARVAREGKDATVVCYSNMVPKSLAAARELEAAGVDVEVIDLRTVDYAGIDYDTIGASVRKTGRVVIAEEGIVTGGMGGHLAHEIQHRFFDYLDAEIARVAAQPVVMPVSKAQETRALPQPTDVADAVRWVLGERD